VEAANVVSVDFVDVVVLALVAHSRRYLLLGMFAYARAFALSAHDVRVMNFDKSLWH
jgi:hypothetical protein